MRVLIVSAQFRPIVGGAERQAERQARALAQRGCDVEVWTPKLVPSSLDVEHVDGYVVRRIRIADLAGRVPVAGVAFANLPSIALQVAWALWDPIGRADVVHCHIGGLLTLVAAYVASVRRVPVVCKAATAGERSDIGEVARGGPSNRIVAAGLVRAFDRWIATTPAVIDALSRAGVDRGRIVLVPNGVELPSRRRRDRPGVGRFLYVGRISSNAQRDVPCLVRAFDRVVRTSPDAELTIVGDGDLFDATRAEVGRIAARARVNLTGPSAAEPWLEWADAFVLPSRLEGLSNALLEAMSYELPCIANDIAPNRYVLEDGRCGVLVPVGDENALAEAMLRFIREPGYARELGVRGRRRVEDAFSIGAVADRCLDLYRELRNGK